MRVRALFLATALCAGCNSADKENSEAKNADNKSLSAGEHTSTSYTVRGKVRFMAEEGREIEIHHEKMPTFVNKKGKVTGMASMVMPFYLAEGIDKSSFKVDDMVQFDLDVDYARKPVLLISKIDKLPADTNLQLK